MKLIQIAAEHLKGNTFQHDLAPVTIFKGPNFSGKTSRLSAAQLVLYGTVPNPNIKQTPRDVFLALSSSDTMKVWGKFDTGLEMDRFWVTNETKGISNSSQARHGKAPVFPEVMFNPRHYLGLSDAKRTEYVFNLLDLKGEETAEQQVKKSIEDIPTQNNQEFDARNCVLASLPKAGQVPFGQWCEMAVHRIKERRDLSTAVAKRMTELVRGLTQLRSKQSEARPIADVRRDHAKVEADRKAIDEQISQLLERIHAAQVNLTKLQGKRDGMKDHEQELRKSQGLVRKAQDKLARARTCPTCKAKISKEWKLGEAAKYQKQAEKIKSDLDECIAEQTDIAKRIREQTKIIADTKKLHGKEIEKRQKILDALSVLSKELREASELSSELGKEQQALEERGNADAEIKLAKAALTEIQRIQTKIVDSAFTTFLAIANRLTQNILPSPLIFQEGVIGRMKNGRFFPHSAFTTAEESVALAGISMALSQQSPFKLIIMDDMSLIDPPNLTHLMTNIDQCLKDGLIDQFIGADTREELKWGGGAKEVCL